MRESDNEILARAYEVLEQANRTLDQQQQRDPVAGVEPMPVADWRRCTTTQEMTTGQFDQWCRDGKPELVARNGAHAHLLPAVTKSKVDAMVRAAVAEERANAQASLDALASIMGEETGKADAKLAEQIRQLRIELVELKAELHDLRGERSTGAIDLPDWRHAVTH